MASNSENLLPLIINGKFFELVSENDGLLKAKCLTCIGPKATISGSRKASSNFVTHLKRCHPEKFAEYDNLKKLRERNKKSSVPVKEKKVQIASLFDAAKKSRKQCT